MAAQERCRTGAPRRTWCRGAVMEHAGAVAARARGAAAGTWRARAAWGADQAPADVGARRRRWRRWATSRMAVCSRTGGGHSLCTTVVEEMEREPWTSPAGRAPSTTHTHTRTPVVAACCARSSSMDGGEARTHTERERERETDLAAWAGGNGGAVSKAPDAQRARPAPAARSSNGHMAGPWRPGAVEHNVLHTHKQHTVRLTWPAAAGGGDQGARRRAVVWNTSVRARHHAASAGVVNKSSGPLTRWS